MLVPAALGGIITKDNVASLQCSIIAEAANAPVTPEADEYLQSHGVDVLPDILTNAGT